VFFAYAVVTPDEALLFVNDKQLDDAAKAYLGQSVTLKAYEEVFDYLKQLPASLSLTGDKEDVRLFPYAVTWFAPHTGL
jgi:Xaa-Pro aminopeptidase